MNLRPLLIVLIPYLFSHGSPAIAQSEFGRFYTTPRQRAQLDDQRSMRPQDEIEITIDTGNLPETEVDDQPVTLVDSITVNGLVYRSDGENTAWINSNVTIEGSIENQYTRISERNIHRDKVEVTLPDNRSRVDLKVGQQYDVHSGQVYDLGETPRRGPVQAPAEMTSPQSVPAELPPPPSPGDAPGPVQP